MEETRPDPERDNLEKQKLRLEVAQLEDSLTRQLAQGYLHHRTVHVGDSISRHSVNAAIREMTDLYHADADAPIEVVFCSPGGTIFDGLALFDHIRWVRARGTKVDTTCLGWSASMAGILLQAGETRRIGRNSWLMIHEASMSLLGATSSEFRDETKLLDRLEGQILDIFAERSGHTPAWIREQFHRKDWWLSAEEALELRFADEVV